MKKFRPVLLLAALTLSACGSPQDTVADLQREISAYPNAPTEDAATMIQNNFARLDEQITKLRADGDTTGAEDFARQRDALQAQYAAARLTASLLKAKQAAEGVGQSFRQAGEAIGQAFKAPNSDSGATNASE
jgi:predicted alpha/beta hydrolase